MSTLELAAAAQEKAGLKFWGAKRPTGSSKGKYGGKVAGKNAQSKGQGAHLKIDNAGKGAYLKMDKSGQGAYGNAIKGESVETKQSVGWSWGANSGTKQSSAMKTANIKVEGIQGESSTTQAGAGRGVPADKSSPILNQVGPKPAESVSFNFSKTAGSSQQKGANPASKSSSAQTGNSGTNTSTPQTKNQ